MIVPLIVALCFTSVLSDNVLTKPHYDLDLIEIHFEEFIEKFNKSYSVEEKSIRFAIFHENVRKIQEMNTQSDNAVFVINHFADLTPEEFTSMYTGFNPERMPADDICVPFGPGTMQAPEEFDWRSQNVVTPPKDQSTCQSCWAFSSTACVESAYAIKYQQQLDLSEQQLIDCDTDSNGCGGGWPYFALSSIVKLGGQMSEADYQYHNSQGSCSFRPEKAQVKLSACNRQIIPDEETVKSILFNQGPISFGLDASNLSPYGGGIFSNCGTNVNHAVLLVGYGTDGGQPYWLVKNSYGPTWGEQGFFRIPRGIGACGMMIYGFFGAVVA